ncbi:MAG: HD domain-containing protein [Candidatus Woesearchaeota archaeon]
MQEEELQTIHEKANKRYGEAQAKHILYAAIYAQKSHEGQTRKTGEEYITHPLNVAKKLLETTDKRITPTTIIAALLHDTLEDTKTTSKQLEKHFGRDVTRIVQALTKTKNPENKQEEDKQYHKQLQEETKTNPQVGIIKLADVIDNSQDMNVYTKKRKQQRTQHLTTMYKPLSKQLRIYEKEIQELEERYEE